jgi:hypothetical protein
MALGDVTIQALTPASQPSSITTTGDVSIFGNNVLVNSTINHKVGGAGVRFGDDFQISAQHSVNVFKEVGARRNVFVIADGTVLVSGNMVADTDKTGNGVAIIINEGAGSTTVSGNVTSYGPGVGIFVNGELTIAVNVVAGNRGC